MKISAQQIMNRINANISVQDLSNKLFQLGHENTIYNNTLDIEITPNRGDCLSLLGILRELSVFFDVDIDFETHDDEIEPFSFNFENLAPEICKKITFLKIEIDDEVKEFPNEICNYFRELEVKRNNFFTDISNYISYELGQPTHCYDLLKINEKMVLTELNEENIFKTLQDEEIRLTEKNAVFKIGKEIVNLAGVMGGASTSCSKKTRSVLIECAYFNPENIIGQSIKYDIQSDAAYKFERGVDINIQELALKRFISIVAQSASIKNIQICSNSYFDFKSTKIPIDVNKINSITGLSLHKESYITYLKKLGFKINKDVIEVPSYRDDIENHNDLAEEVARAIGYDEIPRQEIILPKKKSYKTTFFDKELYDFLIENNFYEVINFPFVTDQNKQSISVDNSLDSNKRFLRSNLMNSLINNLTYNEKRQKDSIKLFEISDLYFFDNKPSKTRKIGIIASGRISKDYKGFSQIIDKEYIKNLFKPLILLSDSDVVEIPREGLDTKNKNKIIYVEIDLHRIELKDRSGCQPQKIKKKFINYEPISEFPSSNRDISFSIKNFLNYERLQDQVFNFQSKILKEVFIFDFYQNKKSNEIKIGFRFIFQSKTKTLTDSEINKEIDQLIKNTLDIDGVSIPGYKD